MICSCGAPITFTPETFVGAFVTEDVYAIQANCLACGSTRSCLIWESEDFAIEGAATRPRCKALVFTPRANNRGPIVLAQCAETETEMVGGHALCFAHRCARANPNRSVPVELVNDGR